MALPGIIWYGSGLNCAMALGHTSSLHMADNMEDFRDFARIRYNSRFGSVVLEKYAAKKVKEPCVLIGSADVKTLQTVLDKASKLPVTTIALAVNGKIAESDFQMSGWLMGMKLVHWETLGSLRSGESCILLLVKGMEDRQGIQQRLEVCLQKAAKSWPTLELRRDDPRCTMYIPDAVPEAAEGEEPAKKKSRLDLISDAQNELKALPRAPKTWFVAAEKTSAKRKIGIVPPQLTARSIIMAKPANQDFVYVLGPTECLNMIGWTGHALNFNLVSPKTTQSSILAASLPKPVAAVLLNAALPD